MCPAMLDEAVSFHNPLFSVDAQTARGTRIKIFETEDVRRAEGFRRLILPHRQYGLSSHDESFLFIRKFTHGVCHGRESKEQMRTPELYL